MNKLIDGLRTKFGVLKAVIQSTWFWRVYGVCAMKRTWMKLLIAVSLVSCLMIARISPGLLTPILELQQMNREEGILLSISFNPKGHDTLRIRTDNGKERVYLGGSMEAGYKTSDSVGKKVTVWSQRVYEGWPPFIFEGFKEVKQGDKMLLNYSVMEMESFHANFMSTIKFLCYLIIFPLLIVGWLCRKSSEE